MIEMEGAMQIPVCETSVDADGRELTEHGAALFPIAAYHDDMTRAKVPWHWHDESEAVVVTEGSAVFLRPRARYASYG